jgi:predicted ATPase/class 3 adenylate cyclase
MSVKLTGMTGLPSGTVTFLFTDVEGSTELLHSLGTNGYAAALAKHRRIMREAFTARGGVEVDTQGDAFFIAFPTAAGALEAARAIAEGLAAGPIRVRMGLHTGTPLLTDEGYIGTDVHRAARIAAAGHGGQVLLSSETVALVGSDGLLDLGEHRLKDFDEPIPIFQVGDERFPPLKTISNTNLPRPASSFVGREAEVAQLAARLRQGARLVTLTGPGGSGKTRLAIETAATLVAEFKAGVFWVDLAPLRDPLLVPGTIGQVIGAKDGVAEHIGQREMLLVLDNLEQVIAAGPRLAGLVEACPNLRLLVTSRERLRVRGEVEVPVAPLAHPDAVTLFCERAQVDADVEVHQLCLALDNLPLALELAAARASVLSPAQILQRLSGRLDVLKGGRDADPRQQSLRATIEWSHELLAPHDQQLFARLAVFVGGWTLEAAEAVVDADLDGLESVVDKSLVRHAEVRFWMLQTIREYAAERLELSVDAEDIRRRHAEYYLRLADAANLSLEALDRGPQRHELVVADEHNLRAAIDWAADADPELGLRLMHALENFWITRDPAEGARRHRLLLGRAGEVDPLLLARAYRDYGGACHSQRILDEAQRAYEQAMELFRQVGDTRGVAEITMRLGMVAFGMSDHDRGWKLLEDSVESFRRIGYTVGELQALSTLGHWEFERGNPDRGWELTTTSLELAREAGWTWWEANVLGQLAERALEGGQTEAGERWARELLALAWKIDDRINTFYGLGLLAWAAAENGALDRAGQLWSAIEAEDARRPVAGSWVEDRQRYATHLAAAARPDVAPRLETAVEVALSS